VIRHIVEREWCATLFELSTAQVVVPVFESIQVIDGQITSFRVFLDRYPNTNLATL